MTRGKKTDLQENSNRESRTSCATKQQLTLSETRKVAFFLLLPSLRLLQLLRLLLAPRRQSPLNELLLLSLERSAFAVHLFEVVHAQDSLYKTRGLIKRCSRCRLVLDLLLWLVGASSAVVDHQTSWYAHPIGATSVAHIAQTSPASGSSSSSTASSRSEIRPPPSAARQ